MNIVAIIQARMSSSRLPGKVLLPLGQRPMLWHVVSRARLATRLTTVAVATSTEVADDAIADFCAAHGLSCFRGSQNDVLDRFRGAAEAFEADVIVRLTADCPLIDPGIIDTVVAAFTPGETDYVSNVIERTYPDGLDTEVFSRDALERAWREAEWESEREHVTPYIWKHPEKFRLRHVRQAENLSALRWTVDEPGDLLFVRAVFGRLGPGCFVMDDVLRLLRAEPDLGRVNAGIETNEGYRLSLERNRRTRSTHSP